MGAARRQWRRRNQRTIMTMTFGSNPTYHWPQSPSPIYGFMSPWGICEKLNDSQSSAEKRQGQFIEQTYNTRSREASKTLKGPCTFVAARIRIYDLPCYIRGFLQSQSLVAPGSPPPPSESANTFPTCTSLYTLTHTPTETPCTSVRCCQEARLAGIQLKLLAIHSESP